MVRFVGGEGRPPFATPQNTPAPEPPQIAIPIPAGLEIEEYSGFSPRPSSVKLLKVCI
jgi:hypothetical protein